MELWNFAKQIAQSEGRKDDWVYVIDTYKSIGGKEMTMFLLGKGIKFEVLGEAPNGEVILTDVNGDIKMIEKSEIKNYKKKFLKRIDGKELKKSFLLAGERVSVIIYENSTFK